MIFCYYNYHVYMHTYTVIPVANITMRYFSIIEPCHYQTTKKHHQVYTSKFSLVAQPAIYAASFNTS